MCRSMLVAEIVTTVKIQKWPEHFPFYVHACLKSLHIYIRDYAMVWKTRDMYVEKKASL